MDINTRSIIDIENKTSPDVAKQPLQWTKTVRPKMTYKDVTPTTLCAVGLVALKSSTALSLFVFSKQLELTQDTKTCMHACTQ